ncbi:ribonuclease HI [Rhizobium sp. TRM96647]|uniref:ribonuclease H family protein n=1 Tax=unclassified Rhizobium TaxID=2613769 RepID=UPI0021E7D3D1|nr:MULTISPECIES: ribonuclease H [unclassified Rhizobium]MCV3738361.1 ribonuclease HI [Rhizobium sp. TRM96647]MCV3759890.1 ribonuclease HI [Rhizobium sp. TRM96650]
MTKGFDANRAHRVRNRLRNSAESAETPQPRYLEPLHVTSRDVTRYGNVTETFQDRPDRCRGYHIFADGAAVPNPGEGGWGVVVYLDGIEVEALSGGDPVTTNNRMEMTALLVAIETAQGFGAPVTIWSDSQYCVNGANDWRHKWKRHGWRKSPRATEFVKNAELWQAIDAALVDASRSGGITISWVKGHAGIVGNERADELAEIGRQANSTDSLGKLERDTNRSGATAVYLPPRI